MDTKKEHTLEQSIDAAMRDLETVTDEIRVKVHLAGMDAKDTWEKTFEPRLDEARRHAREAKSASKAAINDVVKAFRSFSESL